MEPEFFLFTLALIWIIAAVVQDVRQREVANWLNYGLVLFAFIFRVFYSLLHSSFSFLLYGLVGFGIFFVLAYLFYYCHVFAGGDAKLFMALGMVLPTARSLTENIFLLAVFVFLLFVAGSIYGFVYSALLVMLKPKKFSQEFLKLARQRRWKANIILAVVFALILSALAFLTDIALLFMLAALILAFPFLYLYAKAIEEACMVKSIKTRALREGDWLYQPVKLGKTLIKPRWEGLSVEEIKLLQRYKRRVKIKEGMPFTVAFLIAFLLFLVCYFLWPSFWHFVAFF